MSIFFKIILAFAFSFLFTFMKAEKDILKEKILKHNNIEIQTKTKDSTRNKLESDFSKSYAAKASVQIIQKRNIASHSSFYYLSFIILVIAIVRFKSKLNLGNQLNQFFKIKIKNTIEYGFTNSFLITSIFICIVSYIFSLIKFSNSFQFNNLFTLDYLKLISIISVYVITKFTVLYLIVEIFNLKNKLIKNKFIWIEFMYIFVCISLPILFMINNSTIKLQNIVLISTVGILILMHLFVLIKIIFNNLNLLTSHVFKSLIYFYVIEIIPILLLMKYIKTF